MSLTIVVNIKLVHIQRGDGEKVEGHQGGGGVVAEGRTHAAGTREESSAEEGKTGGTLSVIWFCFRVLLNAPWDT